MFCRKSFKRQSCHAECYHHEVQRSPDFVVKCADKCCTNYFGSHESRKCKNLWQRYTNFRFSVPFVLLVAVCWTSIGAHASLLREGRGDAVQVRLLWQSADYIDRNSHLRPRQYILIHYLASTFVCTFWLHRKLVRTTVPAIILCMLSDVVPSNGYSYAHMFL